MDDQSNQARVRSFAEAFAGALSASLAQVTGSPWPLEVTDTRDLPTRGAQKIAFRLKVEGGLSGECSVEFYEPQLSELIGKAGDAGSSEESVDPVKILGPLLRSATNQLKLALAAHYGELTFKIEAVPGLASGGMFVVPLRTRADNSSSPFVFLYFDGGLLAAFSSTPGDEQPADPAKRQFHPTNLRLVMDVELSVSLRFGQRQLPLREVLELSSGSVVELDRMVDEPVEMLLDGKVVARGEAVIVDGNYGLRVTEIPQAMESHLLG